MVPENPPVPAETLRLGEVERKKGEKNKMNDIQIFNFQSNEVRVVKDDNGEPWFVAKDVCSVLEIRNASSGSTGRG